MIRCPSCGEENPGRARFCWSCGTALAEEPAAAGEERKVVSVLFVDLVGFTDRSDQADPEDVRATLRPYHAQLKREIERFGGCRLALGRDGAGQVREAREILESLGAAPLVAEADVLLGDRPAREPAAN